MSNTTTRTELPAVQSIGARSPAAHRIRAIGEERGMRLYRVVELLLEGWDMLTEDQQIEAHRQLFARARAKQSA